MRYRGDSWELITKRDWFLQWRQEIDDSGYTFVLNLRAVWKDMTDEIMTELSPKEAAWLAISAGKEFYEANKAGVDLTA